MERIANPLGMTDAIFTGFNGNIASKNTAIADGFLIRIDDYSKFMRMLLNKGMYNDK